MNPNNLLEDFAKHPVNTDTLSLPSGSAIATGRTPESRASTITAAIINHALPGSRGWYMIAEILGPDRLSVAYHRARAQYPACLAIPEDHLHGRPIPCHVLMPDGDASLVLIPRQLQ